MKQCHSLFIHLGLSCNLNYSKEGILVIHYYAYATLFLGIGPSKIQLLMISFLYKLFNLDPNRYTRTILLPILNLFSNL